MTYHTLVIHTRGLYETPTNDAWEIMFGSYDREEVQFEADAGYPDVKKRFKKIVRTSSDTQEAINAAISHLNAQV